MAQMSTIHFPAFTTTKSTLMHASLAYLSAEHQTLDDIIHKRSTCRKSILPTEILLLIKESLVPTITAQLIKQSTIAREAYEQSLCQLLCPDCMAYNLDIYGPDIWHWEQFSGACACISEDPHGHRIARMSGIRHYHFKFTKVSTSMSIPNPKKYVDPEHWLEDYLSQKASTASSRMKHYGHSSLASQERLQSSLDIWDVVGSVLREFKCEVIRDPLDTLPILSRVGRGQRRDFVQVIPLRHYANSSQERVSSSRISNSEPIHEAQGFDAQVTLHRVWRDLGLSLDYTEASKILGHPVPGSARRLRWPRVYNPCHNHQDDLTAFEILLRVLVSLAVACLSIPIGLATVALTILCFYSKPRSFRIL